MAKAVYRYRICPGCHTKMPAGELKVINYHGNHWHSVGGSMRKCPYCGHTGFTQDFKVVHPADADKFVKGKYGHMVHR